MTAKTKIFRSLQALVLGAALIFAAGTEAGATEKSEYLPGLFSRSFHCGETFITFPDTDSLVWTIRKTDVTRVVWPKPEYFTITTTKGYHQMMEPQSFEIEVHAAFVQPVIACLN